MKRILLLLIIIIINSSSYSQKKFSAKTGQTTLEELKMKIYDKDSTAVALVLYEQGNTYMNPNRNYDLSTDYYYRIKILKKEGFKKGTIKIPYYKKETIEKIEGYTYNIVANTIQKKHLLDKDIFKNKETENWNSITFTLPNLKVGSVIEYKYRITSPYLQLDDWEFQSDIPKVKSEYHSAILANYKYNVSLKGYYPLDKNNPSVIKRCHQMPGFSEGGCAVLDFGMNDMPAFKEESYMTHKKNFISRITFELSSVTHAQGNKTNYTDTWKSADKRFKSGEYFGSELRKSTFFKKNLPAEIQLEKDLLKKAKKIYYFIQDHYTDNNKSVAYYKINTKKTFNNKSGSVAEINVALMNALKAGGLDAKVALLTTRHKAKPTKVYPVISEFNYIIVKLTVNNKEYFLDASDKQLTFGLVPFKTLNGDVRVMDFKKGSYWQTNSPTIKSEEKVNLIVNINNDGEVKGKLRVSQTGYDAYFLRQELSENTTDNYLEKYENDNKIEVIDYKITGDNRKDSQITQVFDFQLEPNDEGLSDNIYLNPFFHEAIKTNPFKLDDRLYPVDFGFKINYMYRASINIPDNYVIKELPKSKAFSLPNKGGTFIFNIKKLNGKLTIFFKFQLAKTKYNNQEYFALKEFFNQIIKVHSSSILLEKK